MGGLMLDKYSDSQKLFYNYFKAVEDNGHISHAYLIETNGVSYYYNLALDLAKFVVCNGVYNERICSLIDKGNYSNLKIIGNDDSIKKSDIVLLKSDFSMKSTDNNRQVYILCNVDNLNKSSANSLLKFLEEPESDVIAILLCDKVLNVLPTIVSRCQNISLINDGNIYESIFVSLYKSDDGRYEDFVRMNILKFFDIYLNIEENGVSVLSDTDFYNLKDYLNEFLCTGYYLYYDCLNFLMHREIICSLFDVDIKKLAEKNSVHDIICKMEIINRFIFDFKYNVNINLFLDNFIISMGSV